MTPQDVLDFWLAAGADAWFKKSDAFDAAVRARFLTAHEAAARGDLDAWEATREGSLALLILLDQFSRNLHRGSAQAFAADAKARGIASRALDRGFDAATPMPLRQFFYLRSCTRKSWPTRSAALRSTRLWATRTC